MLPEEGMAKARVPTAACLQVRASTRRCEPLSQVFEVPSCLEKLGDVTQRRKFPWPLRPILGVEMS